MRRAGTLLAALLTATALAAAGASAQTLTNPVTKSAAPAPATAKSLAHEPVETCSGYGAGFVRLPGSEACIKIGGGVTTEATGVGR
jgi:hypothetical protein